MSIFESPDWKHTIDRIQAEQLVYAAKDLSSWKAKARQLRRAADKIFEDYFDANMRIIQRAINREEDGFHILDGQELEDFYDSQLMSIYYLLIGYSLENLFKGILLKIHPEYFKPDSKMGDFKSHDLKSLSQRAGVALESGEEDWMMVLTAYIVWQGKYPIPLHSKDDRDRTKGIPFKGREHQNQLNLIWEKTWQRMEAISANS